MQADAPPGWYGKLSMLGDFAQRRLPDAVVQACDQWLATTMQALPQLLGPSWPWAYLEGPLLRFACAPGVLGSGWWFGVLMPSCDNVGRYFPLWVAQPRALAPTDAQGLAGLALWYEALAQAALRTLDDGASVAGFERALCELPAWPADPVPASAAAASLPQAVAALAGSALAHRLEGCTLWWPALRGPGHGVQLHCAQGLPDAAALAQLMLPAGQGVAAATVA